MRPMLPSWIEVQEAHAAADVLLGDRDHQPQVGRCQLLARVAADPDQLALAMGQLRVEWEPRGPSRDASAGPRRCRPRPSAAGPDAPPPRASSRRWPGHRVVAGVQVAVVNGEVRPVQQLQERLGGERLVVGRDQVAPSLIRSLVPSVRGFLAGLDQVEVRRGDEQVGGSWLGPRRPPFGRPPVRRAACTAA